MYLQKNSKTDYGLTRTAHTYFTKVASVQIFKKLGHFIKQDMLKHLQKWSSFFEVYALCRAGEIGSRCIRHKTCKTVFLELWQVQQILNLFFLEIRFAVFTFGRFVYWEFIFCDSLLEICMCLIFSKFVCLWKCLLLFIFSRFLYLCLYLLCIHL